MEGSGSPVSPVFDEQSWAFVVDLDICNQCFSGILELATGHFMAYH